MMLTALMFSLVRVDPAARLPSGSSSATTPLLSWCSWMMVSMNDDIMSLNLLLLMARMDASATYAESPTPSRSGSPPIAAAPPARPLAA